MDRERIEADVEAVLPALTKAIRAADTLFESGATGGGGTRHWIRDCLVGALQEEGLTIIPVAALAEAEAENARLREAAQELQRRREKWAPPGTVPFALAVGMDKLAALASRPGEGAA